MVALEKIQSSLFPNLYESFLIDDDPLSTEQDWRNVFDYGWETGVDHCGYALLDDGKVVGMLGMIFSNRLINGTVKKFCNLHTWWVHENHRGQSLVLLRPILKLKEYTITHFTPCDRVRAVTKKLGFSDLRTQLKILLPFGGKRKTDDTEFIDDEAQIVETISEPDQKILADHRPYKVGNLLVRHGDEDCYLLYTHVVRHRLPYCHIHYISNKQVFEKAEREIRYWLLKKHNTRFVTVDVRLVRDMKFAYSFNFWAPGHGLYKSSDVQPDQIDNLYSDVVFLKLTCLPHMTHEFGQMARRLLPGKKHPP